jgi:hypothetical protein
MELEIKVQKPIENKPIEFNKEEITKFIEEKVNFYKVASNIIYPDNEIKNMKKDRATINNGIKSIKNKIKSVKAEYLLPLQDFEDTLKGFVKQLEAPRDIIDTRVKECEEKVREQKEAEIMKIYGDNIGEISEILTYERIKNDKWLNVTFKMKDVEKEILENITRVKSDLQAIEHFKSEFEVQIKDVYLRNFILSDAFKEKTRLEELKLRNERLKQEQEQVQKIVQHGTEQVDMETGEVIEIEEIGVYTWRFKITTTIDKKDKLKKFMLENNINYKKVE